jgi:predicted GNAT family N-acyltransferase
LEQSNDTPTFSFEPLNRFHDRAAFSCADEPILEKYLKTQARQDAEKNLAAVYVMTPDGKAIAGYYTLSQYTIRDTEIPEQIRLKLTKHSEIPATLIGRLARHTDMRGKRAGDLLLADALQRCLQISGQIASWAVVVEAKNAKGADIYRKWNFIPFPTNPLKLFLPTTTIEEMFS